MEKAQLEKAILVPQEIIEQKIFLIRGHKVMLSNHLAELYNVETRSLIQAVKRNKERFPGDFMFQLTWEELKSLKSQIVILDSDEFGAPREQKNSSRRGKHFKFPPYAFTEQGIAMLSSVLRSKRAIQVNIAIMRAFVKLREILSTHKELSQKLVELEQKIERHDKEIKGIFEAIRQLMVPIATRARRKIGFRNSGVHGARAPENYDKISILFCPNVGL
jgi:phage regulator Rha-like protein